MAIQLFIFLSGLALLLAGGESLVRGAAAIARASGVPPVVVGLTVVAFGTSAPELVVAVVGTTSGAGGVAFGNAVGASITNIAFVLGIAALFRPLEVHPSIVTRELPMLLLASTAALVVSSDEYLGGGANRIERADGLILCLLFTVFLYYTIMALLGAHRDPFIAEARNVGWGIRAKAVAPHFGLVLLGILGLTVGGNLLVDSAVRIAIGLGVTPAAIGLTIVSLGTTIPELVASISAVRRGETDLAVGNVVGSNIFNLLMVLGLATALNPIDVPARGPFALTVATLLTVALLVLAGIQSRRFGRMQGLLLLLTFLVYNGWIAWA